MSPVRTVGTIGGQGAGRTGDSAWGPIQALLDDPHTEEVWWNDPARIFYAVDGVTRLSNIVLAASDAEAMVLRAVTACGRRLDTAHPFVDAQLADGSRLHVVIPPIARDHWAVNIRRYVVRPDSLTDLVERRTLTAEVAATLHRAVAAGANVVVSGGTHTGKTTVLNALLGACGGQRIVSCEEVRELRLGHTDWVSLQTRDAGLEGTGAVGLRDLVREGLRMRPGRVVVGEVRGAESLDLMLAMNCGIPAAATVHANSAEDAVDRLTGLPLLAGPNISAAFVARTVGRCVDLIVHLARDPGGRRFVEQVATVAAGPDGPRVGHLYAGNGGALTRCGAELPAGWQS
ncbi:MAG: ATPase, T2SS/T4P/T4SS family [Candidatus Nanopelagicales bacterium]